MLDDLLLSDLFFNYHHDQYESQDHRTASPDELAEALMEDAAEFADNYSCFGKDAQWYFDDFFHRL